MVFYIWFFFTFFGFIGFMNRKSQAGNVPDGITGFSNVHLYSSGWKFACHSHGHSVYNPQGVLTKFLNRSRTAGCLSFYNGDIYLNLPVVNSIYQSQDTWRGYRVETLEEAVEYIIEHEALHSAIAQHKPEELEKQENQFRQKWREASRLQKLVLFYTSAWHVLGHGTSWNEEHILARIQNARQSHPEIQAIRRAVRSD